MSDQHRPTGPGSDAGPGSNAPPPPPGYGQQGYGQQPPPPPPGYDQQGYGQQPHGQGLPYAQPASFGGGPQAGRPADLLPRFLARLIDYVILAIVAWIVVSVIILGMVMGVSGGALGLGMGTNYAAGAVSAVLTAALYLAYFTLMESSRGKTIGKMVLNLEVHGAGGGRPTTAEALKRNAWTALGILSVVPLVGSLVGGLAQLVVMILIAVTINGDPARRQGWHDKFAGGTTVVKTS